MNREMILRSRTEVEKMRTIGKPELRFCTVWAFQHTFVLYRLITPLYQKLLQKL